MRTLKSKFGVLVVKYTPAVFCVVTIVTALVYLHGGGVPETQPFFGVPFVPSVVFYIVSNTLGFCFLHRMFIAFSWLASHMMSVMRHYSGLFQYAVCLAVVLFGCFLLIQLSIHLRRHESK